MTATPGTWHLDRDLIGRYAADALDAATAASVEAHVLRCDVCRDEVAVTHPGTARLDAVWTAVVDRVDAPRVGLVERGLRRVGLRESEARLLAATPSLQASWLVALVLVLAFAVAAAHGADADASVFLLVAPLVPVAGVGFAYGPAAEPAYDLTAAAPYSAMRLLLLRSASVVSASLVLAVPASLALPATGWPPVAWLLPALALTSLTLAASTRVAPHLAASAVTVGWASMVGSLARYADPADAVGSSAQLVALGVITAAAPILARRRTVDLGSPS